MGELTKLDENTAITHLSLPESVYQVLRRRILNNDLGAGTRLVETALAEELGVSRSTLRLALRQLAQDGLVEIAPRRHSVVTRMSEDDIRDVCYARYILEEGALRAVPAAELGDLADALDEVSERMHAACEAEDVATVIDLDTEFHNCLIRQSGKERLADLWAMLNAQMGALMRSSMEQQEMEVLEAWRRHREFAEIVRKGDRDAIVRTLYSHYLRD